MGGVHGDGIRDIVAGATSLSGLGDLAQVVGLPLTGAFFSAGDGNGANFAFSNTDYGIFGLRFAARRVVPTTKKNQPRAWGALPCVYLGAPAS